MDMWGLGCLIWEVFNGPLSKTASLKTVDKVRWCSLGIWSIFSVMFIFKRLCLFITGICRYQSCCFHTIRNYWTPIRSNDRTLQSFWRIVKNVARLWITSSLKRCSSLKKFTYVATTILTLKIWLISRFCLFQFYVVHCWCCRLKMLMRRWCSSIVCLHCSIPFRSRCVETRYCPNS